MFFVNPVFANPEGGAVSAGSATINTPNANTVQIHQTSDKAVIDWRSFNIASHEKTQFQQPSSSSITLNRIDPRQGASSILGQLQANGHVWLINPAGILFGTTARVDVGGLLATTANISNQDFMSGNYHFVQSPAWNGAVINEGKITIADKGLSALVAPGVENKGVIKANLGKVILAAGNEYTLDLYGDGLIQFGINATVLKAAQDKEGKYLKDAVHNSGKIIADGGTVLLTAQTAAKVVRHTINMDGYIQAKSVVQKGGTIILLAGNEGNIHVSGNINASGKKLDRTGGKVKVLGKTVVVDNGAKIDVSGNAGGGEVLIGGDYQGKNPNVPNAKTTYVAKNTEINADALISGNGGKVIVWADDTTGFYGNISARGGAQNGNGGFIETSGKNLLQIIGGKVDASAKHGLSGQWLLDPANVTISSASTANGSFDGSNPNTFTTSANNAIADVDTINASLNSGTSVTILTTPGGTQAGNITLLTGAGNEISKTAGGTATLTLDAVGSILLNNTITSTSGALNVVLTANAITIGNTSNSTITTLGGNFTGTAQNAFNFGVVGNATLGVLNVGSGTVSISANQDGAGTQGFAMTSGSSITSTNTSSSAANISVNTTTGTGSAALRDIAVGSGGTITVTTNDAGNDITQASGTLDSGAGTVTLSTAQTAGRSIGVSGTPVIIKAGTLNATTGSGGIFITNTGTNALDLGTINTTGGLTLTSNSSSGITDSGTLSVTGAATLDTSATQNITLNSAGNNFGTFAVTSGNNVSVLDTDALILGTSTISGTYGVTAGGSLTQSGVLTISGTPTFTLTAANSDIVLSTQANTFSTTLVFTNNGNVRDLGLRNISGSAVVPTLPTGLRNLTLIFDIAALTLPSITLSGSMTATANGAMTQSGALSGTTLTAKTINDSGAAITLNNSSNEFSTVNLQSRNAADTADSSGMIQYQDATGFDLTALHTTSNASLTAGGNITDSTTAGAVVGGTTTLDAGSNNITLNTTNNDFNAVVISNSNNTTLVDTNALIMGASTVGGTLNLTTNDAITQSGALSVTGTTTLTPGAANNIVLDNTSNNFSTIRAVNGNDVTFVDANSLVLGASTISGTLTVKAGGNITENGVLTISGIPTFTVTAANSDILLNTQANDFSSTPVFTNNANIHNLGLRNISATATVPTLPTGLEDLTLTFNNTAMSLPTVTLIGNLTITAGDVITQTGALSGVTLAAETHNDIGAAITLTNSSNDFTNINLQSRNAADNADTAGIIQYRDANGFNITGIDTTSNATLTAAGDITDSGDSTIGGTASFTTGSLNNITLDRAGNDFNVVTVISANDINLRDTNSLILDVITANGTFTVRTAGSLTQTAAISAAGATSLRADGPNNITLTNSGNNFSSVGIVVGNNVSLVDNNALELSASTISGTLDVTAGGTISQSGVLTVTSTPTFTVSSANSDILLATSANNFTVTPIFTNNGNIRDLALRNTNIAASVPTLPTGLRNLTLTFNNAGMIFPAITLTGNLTATAGDTMTQSGALIVPGTTTLIAGTTNDITLNNSNNNFGTIAITSGNNVILVDADSLIFDDSTVSGALDVATNGSITQSSGNLVITGDTTLAAGAANDITLDTSTNNFSTVNITNANNVTLRDANSIVLGTSDVTNNLTATATTITQNGTLSGNKLIAKTLNNAGGAITLNTFANDFTTINLKSRNAADTSNDTGTIAYEDSNGFDVEAINTANASVNALNLVANGNITGSGTLTVTGTATLAAGNSNNITLDNSTNNFGAIAITSGNNVALVDTNALILAASTVSDSLNVTTGGALTDSGNISVSNTLTATTHGGITLNNAGNTISNFNASNSNSGNITLINTASPLTITGLSNSGGTVSLTNTGTLAVANGVTINSNNATISITATDLDLNTTGAINSGTDDITIIQNTASGSIGLGSTTGTMTISGDELQRMTANNLILTAPVNGQILVNGINETESNLINSVTLSALSGSAGSIIFQNNASTFKALTANADDGITIGANVTTTIGNLTLNADVNDTAGSNDTLNLNANLSAAGNIILSATTGEIQLGTDITLIGNDITINNEMNGTHNLTLNAGSTGDITFNSLGLNLTETATITGNNVTGAVNVLGLALNTNFANLTGFVDGSSGKNAIAKIDILNTISAGTHFFDGIDMFSPSPSPTPVPFIITEQDIIQFIFPFTSESTYQDLAAYDFSLMTSEEIVALLQELEENNQIRCINISKNIALCADKD